MNSLPLKLIYVGHVFSLKSTLSKESEFSTAFPNTEKIYFMATFVLSMEIIFKTFKIVQL